jgi:lipopolysaccharide/colanic/teichoic acid biosynthesis glycosyltransferase
VVKLEYDLYYIKHRNILMDILIMLRTMTQVVGFQGR